MAQWFSQDIFQDEDIEDPEEDAAAVLAQRHGPAGGKRVRGADAAQEPSPPERGGRGDQQPPAAAEQQQQSDDKAGGSSGSDAEREPGTAAAKRRRTAGSGGRGGGAASLGLSSDALAGPEDGFEVVPAQDSGSDASDSEDEFEALDDVAKVGAVPTALLMLPVLPGQPGTAAAHGRMVAWRLHLAACTPLSRRLATVQPILMLIPSDFSW